MGCRIVTCKGWNALEHYFSLQDPSPGFYRFKYNLTMQLSDPIRVIGGVDKCQCYGHSDTCDVNTGVCRVCIT